MGKGTFIETLGQGAAGAAVGAGLGLLLEGHNDRRQRRQQQALTDIQSKANAEAAQHSQELQLDMWNKTNYGAQMEHIKNAGLNPALIYGQTGTGGQTGSATNAGVSAGTAQGNSGEAMGMMMMKAQIQNLEAQTEKTKVETAKTAGVDTEIGKQTIEKTKLENVLLKAKGIFAEGNEEYNNEILKETRDMAELTARQIANRTDISDATKNAEITKAKQETVNTILQSAAIKAGTKLTEAQIEKLSADIAQGWSKISIEKFRAEIEANFKGTDKIIGNVIEQIINAFDNETGNQMERRPLKVN